jgi:hypothetical protein
MQGQTWQRLFVKKIIIPQRSDHKKTISVVWCLLHRWVHTAVQSWRRGLRAEWRIVDGQAVQMKSAFWHKTKNSSHVPNREYGQAGTAGGQKVKLEWIENTRNEIERGSDPWLPSCLFPLVPRSRKASLITTTIPTTNPTWSPQRTCSLDLFENSQFYFNVLSFKRSSPCHRTRLHEPLGLPSVTDYREEELKSLNTENQLSSALAVSSS